MFNFVEKKSFFYFSAIVSFLLSFCVFFTPITNFKSSIISILFVAMLLAMMILYNYNHKEVMKVILASFFTILVFRSTDKLFQSIHIFKEMIVEAGLHYDSIRYTIRVVCKAIIGIIVPVLFINHFVLNYNGKNSKVVININKFLLAVMVLATVMEVISNLVASTKAGLLVYLRTYCTVGSVCSTLFYCMTIVSVEAFINSRRAEKVSAVENKASKSKKYNISKKKSKKK